MSKDQNSSAAWRPRLRWLVPGQLILAALVVTLVLRARHLALVDQEVTQAEMLSLQTHAIRFQEWFSDASAETGSNPRKSILEVHPDISTAVLIDSQGRVLEATNREWVGLPLSQAWSLVPLDPESADHRQLAVQQSTGLAWLSPDRETAIGYYPVSLATGEQATRGLLILAKKIAPEREISRAHVQQLAIETGVFLGALACLAWGFFQFSLDARVFQLVQTVRRFADGHRDLKLPARERDEIGEIGNALNEMMRIVEQSQQRLKESDSHHKKLADQLRCVLDTAMDGVVTVDESQRIVVFNAAAEAIFGRTRDQVLGQSLELLIPMQFRARHHEQVREFGKAISHPRRMGMQRRVKALRGNGEEFPIETVISHTLTGGEKLYTVVVRDVSEVVLSRQQITQQTQVLDQVSDAVSVLNLNGEITYWNRAAERLFGWTSDAVLGRAAAEIWGSLAPEAAVDGKSSPDHAAIGTSDGNMLAVASSSPPPTDSTSQFWVGEIQRKTRDGRNVVVEHRRSPLQDEFGALQGYLCLDIDITDRKKRELLSRRSQRLESIGTLAGGIAHDLNNMLTPVLMGARLLASGRMTGDKQGLLNTMVASAERGSGLVRQLLSFAGGIRGESGPVPIEPLIAEMRSLLEHSIPKTIQIKTRVDKNCPPAIGDETELSQVLMNLCINARDAMPDGGTLTIEAEPVHLNDSANQIHPDARPGDYVLFRITDTGIGMTADILDKIFNPFFTTKEFGQGTGLGLATVQGIVKSHRGFVTVYSELNRGTSFSIYLPTAEQSASIRSGDAVTSPVSGNGQTILVVDDEDLIRQTTGLLLQSAGYQVLTAPDGFTAIDLVASRGSEISIILLDMMMPGIDGLETLRRMRQLNPKIKVIACSGLHTSQREETARLQGAIAFLAKPYSDVVLLATVNGILKSAAD
jgi:two-component system cell cycle sensor histidine kinase/response regulator CckA